MNGAPTRSAFVGFALVAASAFVVACGSSDDESPFGGGSSGAAPGNGGDTSGAGGGSNGGSPGGGNSSGGASGGDSGGTTGSGGTGNGSGGKNVCDGRGETLPNTACYVGCEYDFATPPRYDKTGVCSKFGWKCSTLQYCNPLIHCQIDATCQQYGGPGWLCVPTPTGPLVGECAIRCDTDADCPQNTQTATPYTCKAIDNGTTVVKICRF
ncbi:MAG TPA: hypothetical protein VHE30_27650 [Polyangiaceae bacterium]|nr:hypothetical protein [Polyangiaceae bacterium]